MKRTTTAPLVLLLLSACASRTLPEGPDVGSGPALDGGPALDDELIVSGEVCTSTAEDLLFPVKVVLVVDSSGSMMFSDPSTKNTTTVIDPQGTPIYDADAHHTCLETCEQAGTPEASCASICGTPTAPARQAAAAALVKKLQGNPSVSFAIVRFNSRITVNGTTTLPTHPGEFTTDSSKLTKAIDHLSQADLVADYQGALTATRLLLEHDMKRQSRADRSRTRYVVMFFSDGGVGPVCKPGCENDVFFECDVPRDQWCYTYSIDNQKHCMDMTNWYPYLTETCAEYNTDDKILDEVRSIAKLEDLYGVGGLSVNITYLLDPTLPEAIQDLMGVHKSSDAACSTDKDCATGERCTQVPGLKQRRCKAPSERLLVEMARAGNGSFRRFSSSGQIEFLPFDHGMTNLVVTNVNSRPGVGGPTADSDGDGLSDGAELSASPPTNPDAADSDGDGYGDSLEHILRDQGFDPSDPGKPQTACSAAERVDLDGDGLNACEERALGTHADVADTDHDRIPDGMELVWGTDPSTMDDKVDLDLDGVLSGEEIRAHTDPRAADSNVSRGHGYTYTVKQVPSQQGQCFGFTVRGVRLVATRAAVGASSAGLNRILVYFGESPSGLPQDPGSFKAACIRARLLAGGKEPAGGRVTLEATDFVSPFELLRDLAQARNDPGCRTRPPAASCVDPCKGIPLP